MSSDDETQPMNRIDPTEPININTEPTQRVSNMSEAGAAGAGTAGTGASTNQNVSPTLSAIRDTLGSATGTGSSSGLGSASGSETVPISTDTQQPPSTELPPVIADPNETAVIDSIPVARTISQEPMSSIADDSTTVLSPVSSANDGNTGKIPVVDGKGTLPPAFNPNFNDEDGDNKKSKKGKKNTKKVLIIILVAVLVIAAGIEIFFLVQNSLSSSTSAQLQLAQTTYEQAYSDFKTTKNKANDMITNTDENSIQNPQVLEDLKKAVTDSDQYDNEEPRLNDTSDQQAVQNQITKLTDLTKNIKDATKEINDKMDAVNSSISVKSKQQNEQNIASSRQNLLSEISSAKQLILDVGSEVDDQSTVTNLQTSIDAANQVASNNDASQSDLDNATTTLQNNESLVNASHQAWENKKSPSPTSSSSTSSPSPAPTETVTPEPIK